MFCENHAAQPIGEEKPKKSKKKVLIPVIAFVLVLAIAIGVFVHLRPKKDNTATEGKYYVACEKVYADGKPVKETICKYDEYGNIIFSSLNYLYEGYDPEDVSEPGYTEEYTILEYNEFNKPVRCEGVLKIDPSEVKTVKAYCEYDDKGQLIAERCVCEEDETDYTNYMSYDSNGNLIEEKTEYSCHLYEYDEYGNPIAESEYLDTWLYYMNTYEYTYSDGKPVKAEICHSYQGGVGYFLEMYEYDENGNRVKLERYASYDKAQDEEGVDDGKICTIDGKDYILITTTCYEYVCIN